MSPAQEGKLSQEEVEALLDATQEEEPPPAEKAEPTRRVHTYDFQQPSRFNKAALEQLRKIHEGLTERAGDDASRLLSTPVKTQLVSMEQMKWENLIEEAGDSVVGFVFHLEPLGHRGLLTIGREFAGACLDRMMGGTGEPSEEVAEFTDLDVRTLAAFARGFLTPLPELWQSIGQFQVELGAFVQDISGLDLFRPAEDLFQLCFLLQGSVGSGQVVLSVPFQAVRTLPPQEGEEDAGGAVALSEEGAEAGLRESLRRATLELAVVLGSADVKVARLVEVAPGDVIMLEKRVGAALDVRVNDKAKFRGYPGERQGKYAVKLMMEE
jgi:flagellar motor switch protein FliM